MGQRFGQSCGLVRSPPSQTRQRPKFRQIQSYLRCPGHAYAMAKAVIKRMHSIIEIDLNQASKASRHVAFAGSDRADVIGAAICCRRLKPRYRSAGFFRQKLIETKPDRKGPTKLFRSRKRKITNARRRRLGASRSSGRHVSRCRDSASISN